MPENAYHMTDNVIDLNTRGITNTLMKPNLAEACLFIPTYLFSYNLGKMQHLKLLTNTSFKKKKNPTIRFLSLPS